MSKKRWLFLVAIGQFLFFVVIAAPHAVHHGLGDRDAEECPVSVIATQTSGDLPDIIPLPTPLLLTDALPNFDLVLPEMLTFQDYRSRGPPVSLPA